MLAKFVEIQLNWTPCRWTHVRIMHVGLIGRQNSQLMQNPLFYFGSFFFSTQFMHLLAAPPFSADNLFVGTDATSWIWLRLSLIRFSTFQKYTFAKSTFCRIQKRFEMISTFVPCSQENVIQNKLLKFSDITKPTRICELLISLHTIRHFEFR